MLKWYVFVLSSGELENTCRICLYNHWDCALFPCGHFGCLRCINQLRRTVHPATLKCHICRQIVEEVWTFWHYLLRLQNLCSHHPSYHVRMVSVGFLFCCTWKLFLWMLFSAVELNPANLKCCLWQRVTVSYLHHQLQFSAVIFLTYNLRWIASVTYFYFLCI